jgi:hypothetical protein
MMKRRWTMTACFKTVPVLTQFVTKSGGTGVGSLLAGALK